ncbi:MAG TPA: Ig-like domain-containing protein, partial [Clostridia bacterium]|nr:Ig-like domain-containing protein [Clostridia bacterium]
MKKKIVALMAVIPLILLFTVFSVSGAVSLAISIPVASITIENKKDGVLVLDNANYESNFKLYIHVNPLKAANKGYTKTLELLDNPDGDANEVMTILDDGTVKLKDKIGKVKVTYTSNDGGYTDSVILIATSSKVMSLSATATAINDIVPIDTVQSGTEFLLRAEVYPQTAEDQDVLWSSSDESIVFVNSVTGIATALLSGTAILTATCYDSVKGTLTASTTVTVEQSTTLSQITVNGKDEHTILFFDQSKSLSFYLEMPEDFVLTATSNNPYVGTANITTTELANLTTTKRLKMTINVAGESAPSVVNLTFKNNQTDAVPYNLALQFT